MVDNIAKDLTYRARVLAHNHAGDGVLSDVVLVGKTRRLLSPSDYSLLVNIYTAMFAYK